MLLENHGGKSVLLAKERSSSFEEKYSVFTAFLLYKSVFVHAIILFLSFRSVFENSLALVFSEDIDTLFDLL